MNRATEAAERGARWLLNRLESEGYLRGATHLGAYYKLPAAFQASGHADAAHQTLDFIRRRFYVGGEYATDLEGAGLSWFSTFRIYPHAWLAWATGEPRLIRFLRSQWVPESGGFRAREDGSQEIMTTSMAGLACLAAGEEEVAAGVVSWLERMMEAQPDLTRGLYHVWRPGEGLVAGDGSVEYLVAASKPRQWYFQYGIAAAFLAEYAWTKGGPSTLPLARRYLRASRYCTSDLYRTPQSGKLGWGSAWTYRLTRDSEDAARVDAVVDGLCALQCGDGSWNVEGVYDAGAEADEASRYDVTAEFVALLSYMGATESV